MLDSEIYKMLSNMSEKEIKCLTTMCVVYLRNVYNTDLKKLKKDIKKILKEI